MANNNFNKQVTDLIAKQKRLYEAAMQHAVQVSATEVHREMANRIFIQGEDKNNALIGNYNTSKPIYVNPKNSPKKFATGGKRGNKKKNKEKYKTRYFSSYRDFRAEIGRETRFVDLVLSGRLQSAVVSGIRKQNKFKWVSFIKSTIEQKKSEGMEKHFGKKIFELSQDEKELFNLLFKEEVESFIQRNA